MELKLWLCPTVNPRRASSALPTFFYLGKSGNIFVIFFLTSWKCTCTDRNHFSPSDVLLLWNASVICGTVDIGQGVANLGAWEVQGCAGFCCYSAVHWSIKAVDCTVNSPHLDLGSELVADLKTKASTPCGSPGPGLFTPDIGQGLATLVLESHRLVFVFTLESAIHTQVTRWHELTQLNQLLQLMDSVSIEYQLAKLVALHDQGCKPLIMEAMPMPCLTLRAAVSGCLPVLETSEMAPNGYIFIFLSKTGICFIAPTINRPA